MWHTPLYFRHALCNTGTSTTQLEPLPHACTYITWTSTPCMHMTGTDSLGGDRCCVHVCVWKCIQWSNHLRLLVAHLCGLKVVLARPQASGCGPHLHSSLSWCPAHVLMHACAAMCTCVESLNNISTHTTMLAWCSCMCRLGAVLGTAAAS